MMLSRRIGRWLFVLLIVYLMVTVYITSTVLLSPSNDAVDVDYGSSESDNGDDVSNRKEHIFVEKKYQLFKIRNSKYSQEDIDNPKNADSVYSTTMRILSKNRITPEVNMDTNSSITKNVNVQIMLDEWKEKMELLRHKHMENVNNTKYLHLQNLKRLMKNLPGALKDDKELINTSSIVHRRSKSLDPNTSLPTYNINMQSIPGDIRVYSAYLDERKPTKFIRIVLIGNRIESKMKSMVCKFLLADLSNYTVSSSMTLYETCEGHMKHFSSFIGSCAVPDIDVLLDQVVLSVEAGGTDLYMNVINNGRQKKTGQQKFAICVPPLFGKVNVLRITEFIELSRILGAQHFVFYPKFVSSELSSLLDYYRKLGLATVMLWNLTIPDNDIWYHGQSASVWDCLYRTMFKFKHVAFLDFDEFIVPKIKNTVPEFLTYLHEEENVNDEIISAYKFESAFFDYSFPSDDMPKSLELQQLATMNITMRTRRFSKIRTKLVVNPANVFELGIHHVSKPIEEHYQCHEVNPKLAFIHHYRKCISNYGMNCKITMKDNSTLRHKATLVHQVKQHLLNAKHRSRV